MDGSYPIVTYDDLLKAAQLHMDKDKRNLPARREMSIPPNMTAEDYQGMNLTEGQRISTDARLTYIEYIMKLAGAGYITPEEEEKRVNWIQDAQTREQAEIAFADLQESLLKLKVEQYSPSVTREYVSPPRLLLTPFLVMIIFTFGMISQALSGQWEFTAVFAAGLVTVLLLTVNAVRKIRK